MAISARQNGKHRIVALSGRLDFHNYAATKESLLKILNDEETKSLVIDLGEIEHLDSSGIALIAHVLKVIEKKQGELRLLAVNASVRKIMRLTHLEEYFRFIETEAELSA